MLALGVAGAWIAYAQEPGSPPTRGAPRTGIPADAPGFTGKTATLDTTGYSIGRRIFAPGGQGSTTQGEPLIDDVYLGRK